MEILDECLFVGEIILLKLQIDGYLLKRFSAASLWNIVFAFSKSYATS